MTESLSPRPALQRRAGPDAQVADHAAAVVDRATASSGEPLPAALQQRFEGSLGADLAGVRVHTGSESAAAASAVGARAFAVGQDIHFGAGQYAPDDPYGMHLLAHEVAHTVQQTGAPPQRQHKLEVSSPGDPAELDADRAADAMVRGQPATVSTNAGGLQRDAAPDPASEPDASVAIDWWVDWQNKELGPPITDRSNARTGRDAAFGTMKIIPENGAAPPETIRWVNAAPTGAVRLHPIAQRRGSGGQVSTDIAWGKTPITNAEVKLTQTEFAADPKLRPGPALLESKKRAAVVAVNTQLERALALDGDVLGVQTRLQEVAAAAIGDAPDGYAYDVTVTVRQVPDPTAGNPRAVAAVAYDRADKDERRTALITVPTEIQRLKGSASAETVDQSSSVHGRTGEQRDSSGKSEETSVDVAVISEVTTSAQAEFHQAWDQFTKKLTTTQLAATGSVDGKLGGGGGSKTTLQDVEIDLGTLLGALLLPEAPTLALRIKKAVGKGKLGAAFHTEVVGELQGTLAGKAAWTDEDLRQTVNKFDSLARSKIDTHVATAVKTLFRSSSSEQHDSHSTREDRNERERRRVHAATTETVGVKYLIGEPVLTVKNG